VLEPGCEVRVGGAELTVVELLGLQVRVRDVTGHESTISAGRLLADPGFELLTQRRRPALPPIRVWRRA